MRYYADELVDLHHGDCLDVLKKFPNDFFDSVVTDPPFGLKFMLNRWVDLSEEYCAIAKIRITGDE
jgi:DNA modification methylase